MVQMRADNRADDLRREQERILEQERREEYRQKREDEIRRKAQQREERLLLALKEAQPAVPQTVTIQSNKLPKMREGEEIETFIGMFEAALRAGNVPEINGVPSCTHTLNQVPN